MSNSPQAMYNQIVKGRCHGHQSSPEIAVTGTSHGPSAAHAVSPSSNSLPLPNIAALLNDMQATMATKIAETKDSIEASIDDKITNMKDDMYQTSTSSKGLSFASIVSGEQSTPVSNSADFRTLMRTTRNEEITEDK